jgi:beta-1,4-N-acetylglucosaminyltransferase
MNKQVLVTVGTTKFEDLIINLDNEKFYQLLDEKGYTTIFFQIGSGEYTPSKWENMKLNNLKVKVVRLAPKFEEIIKESEYIITHCGAGSLLESLKNKKKVIGVINEKLMDNHQLELASQLLKDDYIYLVTKINNIVADLETIMNSNKALKEYSDFNYDIIPNIIYEMLDI